jgi:TonB family protein
LETDALDHPMRVVYEVAPQYPRQLDAEHVTGEAAIDFVVDEAGVVRFPKIVSATRPEFGWAAATAVQQWFYDVPRCHGKPVDVHRVMTFDFKPSTGTAAN